MTLSIFTRKETLPTSTSPIPSSTIDSPSIHGVKKRKEAGNYWLGRTLGKGSSGRVKLGYHKVTGEKVAVKIISKSYLSSNASTERAVKREIAIMKLIQHPHIMRLIDVIDIRDSPNLYLILEYVKGGELFEYLITKGRLSEREARNFFQQIIFGMDFCHRHLICHRDLKPENLLLDESFNIKIADFGMASLQPSGTLLETSCGSPHYASPEIVTGVPYNGAASDIWSCGVILYALLCGHLPFDDSNIRQLLYKVKRGKYVLPSFLSDPAKDLILKILVVHPEKRLTMQQIQDHEWFKIDGNPVNPSLTSPMTDNLSRPVEDIATIDDRLLATLQALWVDRSQQQIIDALMNQEYNMEKVAYGLLQRRSAHYWQTKQDDSNEDGNLDNYFMLDRSRKQTLRRWKRPTTICGTIKPREVSHKDNEIEKMIPPPSPDVQRASSHRKQRSSISLHPVRSLKTSVLHRESLPTTTANTCELSDKSRSHRRSSEVDSLSLLPSSRSTTIENPKPNTKSAIVEDVLVKKKAENGLASPSVIQYHQERILQQQVQQQQLLKAYGSEHRGKQHTPDPVVSTTTATLFTPLQSRLYRLSQNVTRRTDYSHSPAPAPTVSPTSKVEKRRLSGTLFLSPYSSRLVGSNNKLVGDNGDRSGICPIDQLLKYEQLRQQQQQVPKQQPTVTPRTPTFAESRPSHPLMCRASPLLTSEPRVASSFLRHKVPTIDSPKISTWLPGLFHFKQPKVCTIKCKARNEKEAFGKIAQVIQEQLNGSFVEHKDGDGNVKRKGQVEMSSQFPSVSEAGSRRTHLIRFKLEIDYTKQLDLSSDSIKQPNCKTGQCRSMEIKFVQQQGDTLEFTKTVNLVEKWLDDYEKEAEFVASANGWKVHGLQS